MRSPIAVAAALALLAACSERVPEPSAPPGRPLAQDGTVARAVTSTPDRARVQLDLATVRAALQLWRGEHGAWPGSLAELELQGIAFPDDLSYDAATGAVRSGTYPSY